MPYKEKEIEKMYFTISEVAKQFNVAASLIRFWETEFEILKPRKTTKGNRLYSKKDIENFRLIYHLVKLKEGVGAGENSPTNNAEIVSHLKNIRKFLETMYNEL